MTWSTIKCLHPHQLATLAVTRGIVPAMAASARIAVYGVEDGAEVIPIASYLAAAEVVAVDTAPARLDAVEGHVSALGLDNVSVHRCQGASELSRLGSFDYILVRDGLCRLKGDEERAALIRACSEALSERGLVVFGYPSSPGWQSLEHLAAWVRQRLTREAPLEAVTPAQVRALLAPLCDGVAGAGEVALAGLEALAHAVISMSDHDLRTQILDPSVAGVRLCHVVALAQGGAGLSYVGEAQRNPAMAQVTEHLSRTDVGKGEDLARLETLAELTVPTARRFSLFSRQEPQGDPTSLLEGCLFATTLGPREGTVDLEAESTVFVGAFDTTVDIESRLLRATIAVASSSWPQAIAVPALLDRAASAVAEANPAWAVAIDQGALAEVRERLIHLCQIGLAELRTEPYPIASELEERPLVNALVRYQLDLGRRATTPLHTDLEVPDILRLLARVTDGTRDAEEIDVAFEAILEEEGVVLEVDGERPPDETSCSLLRRSTIVQGLETLAQIGLISTNQPSPTSGE